MWWEVRAHPIHVTVLTVVMLLLFMSFLQSPELFLVLRDKTVQTPPCGSLSALPLPLPWAHLSPGDLAYDASLVLTRPRCNYLVYMFVCSARLCAAWG